MKKRNDDISVSKGIGIILMVMGHAGLVFPLDSIIYSFHMPLFFILSGYFYKVPEYLWHGSFIKKRIKSLWVPYVIWTIIGLFLHNVFSCLMSYGDIYTYSEILKRMAHSFFFGGHDGCLFPGFWFLKALFCASISIYFVTFVFKKLNIPVFFLIGIYFICIVLLLLFKIDNNTLKGTLYGGIFILLGYIYRKYENSLLGDGNLLIVLLTCIQVTSIYINPNADMLGYSKDTILSYTFFAVTGTLLVYKISKRLKPTLVKRTLVYIGDHTMPILILHGVVFKILNCLFIHMLDFPSIDYNTIALHFTGSWIIYTLTALLLSLGMYELYRNSFVFFSKKFKK